MTKPFDTTTKQLLEGAPGPWMAYSGITPDGPVRVIDADLATVIAEADKVFRIDGPRPYLAHLELQAIRDPSLPRRLWRYSALLDCKHDLRVRSVVILLRPEADSPALTGRLDLRLPDGTPIVEFHYGVIRAWQQPVEPLLGGDPWLLPMALLADVPPKAVRGVVQRIDERLVAETSPETAATIMKAAYLLSGLRYPRETSEKLFEGVRPMSWLEESSTYQMLLDRGRIDEARKLLLQLGRIRFGPPDAPTRTAIETLKDLDRLERLSERLLEVSSWAELLAES